MVPKVEFKLALKTHYALESDFILFFYFFFLTFCIVAIKNHLGKHTGDSIQVAVHKKIILSTVKEKYAQFQVIYLEIRNRTHPILFCKFFI